MKKKIITASCIVVFTLLAAILVYEKDKTITNHDIATVDINYRAEENAGYKVISETLDVSYIHSEEERIIIVDNDEENDNEGIFEVEIKTEEAESKEILMVEDAIQSKDMESQEFLVEEIVPSIAEEVAIQSELAVIDEVVPASYDYENTDFQVFNSYDNVSEYPTVASTAVPTQEPVLYDYMLVSVSTVAPDPEPIPAVTPAVIAREDKLEEAYNEIGVEPAQLPDLEPVIRIELPVVKDEKK